MKRVMHFFFKGSFINFIKSSLFTLLPLNVNCSIGSSFTKGSQFIIKSPYISSSNVFNCLKALRLFTSYSNEYISKVRFFIFLGQLPCIRLNVPFIVSVSTVIGINVGSISFFALILSFLILKASPILKSSYSSASSFIS